MNDSTIYNYLSQSQVHSIRNFAKKNKFSDRYLHALKIDQEYTELNF
jgi:hypothetical protein